MERNLAPTLRLQHDVSPFMHESFMQEQVADRVADLLFSVDALLQEAGWATSSHLQPIYHRLQKVYRDLDTVLRDLAD